MAFLIDSNLMLWAIVLLVGSIGFFVYYTNWGLPFRKDKIVKSSVGGKKSIYLFKGKEGSYYKSFFVSGKPILDFELGLAYLTTLQDEYGKFTIKIKQGVHTFVDQKDEGLMDGSPIIYCCVDRDGVIREWDMTFAPQSRKEWMEQATKALKSGIQEEQVETSNYVKKLGGYREDAPIPTGNPLETNKFTRRENYVGRPI